MVEVVHLRDQEASLQSCETLQDQQLVLNKSLNMLLATRGSRELLKPSKPAVTTAGREANVSSTTICSLMRSPTQASSASICSCNLWHLANVALYNKSIASSMWEMWSVPYIYIYVVLHYPTQCGDLPEYTFLCMIRTLRKIQISLQHAVKALEMQGAAGMSGGVRGGRKRERCTTGNEEVGQCWGRSQESRSLCEGCASAKSLACASVWASVSAWVFVNSVKCVSL
jgi:hypothetical protein